MEEINALRKTMLPGPVMMINLLKFKPDGGRRAYAQYLNIASSLADPEAMVSYCGKAEPDVAAGEEWDFVILGNYPSFEVFAEFMTHPIYQNETVPLRTLALEKALFMISQPADMGEILGSLAAKGNSAAVGNAEVVVKNKLSPTIEEIEALCKSARPGPIVMVNLLKLRSPATARPAVS